MKLTIEIDENKVKEHIEKLVSEQIANELAREFGVNEGHLSYRYHVDIRAIMREVIKENYDMLAKEAVSAAAKSIENKAIKEKMKQILEGV